MGECRQLPANTVESYETLPEMYLGLGVDRDPASGASRVAPRTPPTQGIDLAILNNREALECFNTLVRNNPSLSAYASRTQELIQHFRRMDARDPNHITWAELSRDYGQEAESVAYSINSYLGILQSLAGTAAAPSPSTSATSPADLAGYGNLTQAYVGIGVDRDAATGVSRAPQSTAPQGGLDLAPFNNAAAISRLEELARDNPALTADLHRVQEILRGLRQADPQDPDQVTVSEIQRLYGADTGHILVSINAYLGLVRHVSGPPSATPGIPTAPETDVNPWLIGGLVAGASVLIGGTVFVLRSQRVTPSLPPAPIPAARPVVQNPALQPAQPAPPPPAAPLPPPPERFVRANGGEVIVFPDRPDGVWELGRGFATDGIVPIVPDPTDPAYSKVSRHHAGISRGFDGSYSLLDLGSRNGTRIYREDAVACVCRNIPVSANQAVALQDGDVIGFGSAEYRFRVTPGGPLLDRVARGNAASPAPIAPQAVIEPLRIATPEQSLIARLRGAIGTEEVEIFMREPNGTVKEKYVGGILGVTGEGDTAQVQVRFGNNGNRTFRLDQILTVRGRLAADDLSSQYIHPRITDPQFRDKSVNISRTDGTGMGVLVDFSDPRLTSFLDEYVRPIRERLDRGEISQRQAADMVWRVVHDYVPYDRPRGVHGLSLPNRLYRLGDFIETGVCNERGMLVQVANQYVGVESQLEKGPFMGGRHAWVRSFFPDNRGGRIEVIHDPQHDRPSEVGRDVMSQLYRDDSTPFAKSAVKTIAFDGDMHEVVARARAQSPQAPAAAPIVRTGWEEVLTYRVNDEAIFNALERMDPALARYFRTNISPLTSRATTMSDIVSRISIVHPQALETAQRMAALEGRPLSQIPERAIFELVTTAAAGQGSWRDPDPSTRSRRAAEFETRSRNAGGVERDESRRADPRREEERRERERREVERLEGLRPRR